MWLCGTCRQRVPWVWGDSLVLANPAATAPTATLAEDFLCASEITFSDAALGTSKLGLVTITERRKRTYYPPTRIQSATWAPANAGSDAPWRHTQRWQRENVCRCCADGECVRYRHDRQKPGG